MNNERIYQFNEYVLGYDKGHNDRSCLTISKIQNDNMYVMSSLYDGSADIISLMLDSLQKENINLQQQLDKYKNVIDKIKEIPLKHIDNANKELQIILKNNNDLEYKNQCSHDFEIIKQNVEIIYNDILELLEEVE